MKHSTFLALATAALLAAGSASAKLPPPSEEAKAKAAEAAARTAYNDKVGTLQLCKAQDRIAAQYRAVAKTGAKAAELKPPAETPACTDPGVFAYSPAASAAPPLEASGAHSPAKTAVGPPSSRAPDTPGKK